MRPRPPLLWLFVPWIGLGVWAALDEALLGAFAGYAGLLAIAVWGGIARVRALPLPTATRTVSGSLPVGVWRPVKLRIANRSAATLTFAVFDHVPVGITQRGMPRQFEVSPKKAVRLGYDILPGERGDQHFGKVQVVFWRRFGLFSLSHMCGGEEIVRVYPNFAVVTKYALLALDNRVSDMGIKRRRRRGTGLEFHQLREYRDGDLLRQIDWKATSRRRQLISREYQEERDQQVVFLLDCGRRMHAKDGELSHFDHTLNAALLLTYVALRQGDSVGFLTFSGAHRFLPPQKGPAALNVVLNQVYDLKTTMQPSDYLEAATRVMSLVPRRALVVFLTNLRDEDSAELIPAIHTLRTRHLVLLASLRENVVEDVLEEGIDDFDGALRYCVAQDYLESRRTALKDLAGRGALVLDVSPRLLPISIVNRYLDIKREGLL